MRSFRRMSKLPMTVAEALRLIRDSELTHDKDKGMAASVLAEEVEHDLQITFADMLRCLDYGGYIAECGARCLYVRTGRDGVGRHFVEPFIKDRRDWESYLQKHFPIKKD